MYFDQFGQDPETETSMLLENGRNHLSKPKGSERQRKFKSMPEYETGKTAYITIIRFVQGT